MQHISAAMGKRWIWIFILFYFIVQHFYERYTISAMEADVPLVDVPCIHSRASWELPKAIRVFVVTFMWRLSSAN